MQMIGFYVLRGQDHDKLLQLTEIEKSVYRAWMEQYHEDKATEYRQLFNSGGK